MPTEEQEEKLNRYRKRIVDFEMEIMSTKQRLKDLNTAKKEYLELCYDLQAQVKRTDNEPSLDDFKGEESSQDFDMSCPECNSSNVLSGGLLGDKIVCQDCEHEFELAPEMEEYVVTCPECESDVVEINVDEGKAVCQDCGHEFIPKIEEDHGLKCPECGCNEATVEEVTGDAICSDCGTGYHPTHPAPEIINCPKCKSTLIEVHEEGHATCLDCDHEFTPPPKEDDGVQEDIISWITTISATDVNFKSNLEKANLATVNKAISMIEGEPGNKGRLKALHSKKKKLEKEAEKKEEEPETEEINEEHVDKLISLPKNSDFQKTLKDANLATVNKALEIVENTPEGEKTRLKLLNTRKKQLEEEIDTEEDPDDTVQEDES